jgi:hypothetical protein
MVFGEVITRISEVGGCDEEAIVFSTFIVNNGKSKGC